MTSKTNEETMPTAVNLPISTCGDCPHKAEDRYATADSWEWGKIYLWYCKKTDRAAPSFTSHPDYPSPDVNSSIGFEEDGLKPKKIPDWCPLRQETK